MTIQSIKLIGFFAVDDGPVFFVLVFNLVNVAGAF